MNSICAHRNSPKSGLGALSDKKNAITHPHNPHIKKKVLRLSVAINKENNIIEMKEWRLVII